MSDLATWISSLTPAQRTLFQLRLQKKNAPSVKLQAIPRRRETGPCPLTFEQERLWLVQQLFPEGAAYNINNEYRYFGRLDLPALLASLREIVRRHEILRTSFVAVDGKPWQVVGPPEVPDLPVVDLSALPVPRRKGELRRRLGDRARQPFDLAGKPLRVTLFQLAEAEYLLFPTMHHVATDWWSLAIFQNELASLYREISQGRAPSLPEPPIQFADFALWQREWLRDDVLERLLGYWRDQLAGAPPLLDLPTDRPRPETARFVGARQLLSICPEVMDRLRSLGQRNEVTPFVTFLAAYAALLFRGSRADDLLIGTPVADRGRPETEHLIGYFLNLLVLRIGVAGEATFQELMKRVREIVYGAYTHQDLPYGKLLDDLRPERTLSHMPLAQISYVYVMTPGAGASTVSARAPEEAPFDPGTSRFDLTLVVEDKPEGVLSFLEYSSALFDATTTLHMARRLTSLLERAAAEPDVRIRDLPLLSEPERTALLREWNDTVAPLPDLCLPDLVAEQVRRAPDALAVKSRGHRLTYGDLGRGAGLLAGRLRRLGVGPEVRVGVALDRSPWVVVALLGVLEAGGAYVPLDPAYPRERLALMVSDAGIQVLITESALAGHLSDLPGLPADIVRLDAEWQDIAGGAPAARGGILPSHLAYVLYTSGSTGQPKGVAVPHRALVNLLLALRDLTGFDAGDGLLAVTSLSFDIAALEIFLPLVAGGHVELASREEAFDGSQLASRLAEPSVTLLQATPATWQMLVDAGWAGRRDLKALCGGEPLLRPLAEALRERTAALWNAYGPTETTVYSTAARIEPGPAPISIGRPVANTAVRVLDRDLRPLASGMPGELYLGGAGLARGYLDRPDLTAERFLPDPLAAEEPGARLYRTGDLARHLADGSLQYLGRVDQQVKVRGFRIEPGEIEAALERHPAVAQAVVVTWGEGSSRRLVAYVVPRTPGTEPRADELRSFLAERLPGQMVPGLYLALPALPLTPSGKIDRLALPRPQGDRPELRESYVVPRNELERVIAASWQEVLGLEKVGVHDNFFDLGGNSLLLFQVRHHQQQALARDLPLNLLFRHPTVASLAQFLGGEAEADTPVEGQTRGEVRKAAGDVRARLGERRREARRQG